MSQTSILGAGLDFSNNVKLVSSEPQVLKVDRVTLGCANKYSVTLLPSKFQQVAFSSR